MTRDEGVFRAMREVSPHETRTPPGAAGPATAAPLPAPRSAAAAPPARADPAPTAPLPPAPGLAAALPLAGEPAAVEVRGRSVGARRERRA